MLTFIGLGLFDEYDISLKGLETVRGADLVYAEFYTSCLMGTNLTEMEKLYGKKVCVLSREDVEQHPDWLIEAKDKNICFLSFASINQSGCCSTSSLESTQTFFP